MAAKKFHHSPYDLSLEVGSRAGMLVGCSVNDANKDLLSLWWAPPTGFKHTSEQEALAVAVFFDLTEAVHDVPRMYAADYNVASGAPAAAAPAARASASGGASAERRHSFVLQLCITTPHYGHLILQMSVSAL